MKAKKPINRRAIAISAALTLVLLIGAALLTLGWQATAAQESAVAPAALVAGDDLSAAGAGVALPPIVVTGEPHAIEAGQAAGGQPALADDAVVAAYQAQLSQAYSALQEAYTQIETLQAAQAPAPESAAYRSDDDGDDQRDEHDAHERKEHREDERKEHDDD